jgi:DNA polymerase-3 subunit beta
MNVLVSKQNLSRLLKRCQGIADKRSTLPILANVLLEATDGGLRVSATDTYLGFTGMCGAAVKKTGSVAVDARDLFDRVKAMPDGDVTLSLDGSALTIKANEGSRRFRLHSINGDDYPSILGPQADAAALTFPVATLLELISGSVYAVSTDETRLHLNSLFFEAAAGKIRAVGTDGHRLAVKELESELDFTSMLVPLNGVLELKRILEDTVAASVTLKRSGLQLFCEVDGDRLTLKLTDAAFVPWQQVIPSKHDRTVSLNVASFCGALRAVKVSASDRTGIVRLTVSSGKLRVESESPESGEGFDEFGVDYTGAETSIGVNAQYALDALGCVTGEDAIAELSGELDPIVIRSALDAASLAVVMPARV